MSEGADQALFSMIYYMSHENFPFAIEQVRYRTEHGYREISKRGRSLSYYLLLAALISSCSFSARKTLIWKGKAQSYFIRRDLGYFIFIFLLKIEMMIKFGVKIKGLGTISI